MTLSEMHGLKHRDYINAQSEVYLLVENGAGVISALDSDGLRALVLDYSNKRFFKREGSDEKILPSSVSMATAGEIQQFKDEAEANRRRHETLEDIIDDTWIEGIRRK